MLPEAKDRRGLTAKGINIMISLRSSHGEIAPLGTYAAWGVGPLRASRQRHKHNRLIEVISWRNNASRDSFYPRPRAIKG